MADVISVGRFSFDPATNQVSGPALYMQEQGSQKLDDMLSGKSAGFNAMLACAPLGSDPVQIVLVALQTDFAGWLGAKQMAYAFRRGRL